MTPCIKKRHKTNKRNSSSRNSLESFPGELSLTTNKWSFNVETVTCHWPCMWTHVCVKKKYKQMCSWFLFWWNVLVVGNGSLMLARRKPPLPACKSCCSLTHHLTCARCVKTHTNTRLDMQIHSNANEIQHCFACVYDKASCTWPANHMSATQIFISDLTKKVVYSSVKNFKLRMTFYVIFRNNCIF